MKNQLLAAVLETPWAILPAQLVAIMDMINRYVANGDKQALAPLEARTASPSLSIGGIAVLPLWGTIYPRLPADPDFFGFTSADRFANLFKAALADNSIGAIVIDVNSPGGSVGGVIELANGIYKARGQKPVVAIANHLAASAAYWIATAADELVVTPSGEVGSIGVFAAHLDQSKALEDAGLKVSLISAGKYKTEANPYEPLSEEARANIQARVDDYYDMFTKAVARHRGVNVSDVRGGFGEGRVVGAQEAVKLGMADRVGTLIETIQRLAKGHTPSRTAAAELEYRQRRARALAGA